MIHRRADAQAKGWYAGPWDCGLDIPVGYANVAPDELHIHAHMNEVYLIARGESTAVVAGETLRLVSGDMLVVEPGEAHTFTACTPDYFHFVLQTPFVTGDKIVVDNLEHKKNMTIDPEAGRG